jgi:hypothetical protein
MDRNRAKWDAYALAACEMLERTGTKLAPWVIVEANDKLHAPESASQGDRRSRGGSRLGEPGRSNEKDSNRLERQLVLNPLHERIRFHRLGKGLAQVDRRPCVEIWRPRESSTSLERLDRIWQTRML